MHVCVHACWGFTAVSLGIQWGIKVTVRRHWDSMKMAGSRHSHLSQSEDTCPRPGQAGLGLSLLFPFSHPQALSDPQGLSCGNWKGYQACRAHNAEPVTLCPLVSLSCPLTHDKYIEACRHRDLGGSLAHLAHLAWGHMNPYTFLFFVICK